MTKPATSSRWRRLLDRFALTPEEKRVIAFIAVALVLGFAVEIYRSNHRHSPPTTDPRHPWRKLTVGGSGAKHRHTRSAQFQTAEATKQTSDR